MGRHSCCQKQKLRKGLWSPDEDEKLLQHITKYGHGCWSSVPKLAGLQRCGKSCRLRWINYLRPDLKRGLFSPTEEKLILELHRVMGNRWSRIASHLPGRTDNEIKNFWNSSIKKKFKQAGVDPTTRKPINEEERENKLPSPVLLFSEFSSSSQMLNAASRDLGFTKDLRETSQMPTATSRDLGFSNDLSETSDDLTQVDPSSDADHFLGVDTTSLLAEHNNAAEVNPWNTCIRRHSFISGDSHTSSEPLAIKTEVDPYGHEVKVCDNFNIHPQSSSENFSCTVFDSKTCNGAELAVCNPYLWLLHDHSTTQGFSLNTVESPNLAELPPVDNKKPDEPGLSYSRQFIDRESGMFDSLCSDSHGNVSVLAAFDKFSSTYEPVAVTTNNSSRFLGFVDVSPSSGDRRSNTMHNSNGVISSMGITPTRPFGETIAPASESGDSAFCGTTLVWGETDGIDSSECASGHIQKLGSPADPRTVPCWSEFFHDSAYVAHSFDFKLHGLD